MGFVRYRMGFMVLIIFFTSIILTSTLRGLRRVRDKNSKPQLVILQSNAFFFQFKLNLYSYMTLFVHITICDSQISADKLYERKQLKRYDGLANV